MNMTGKGGCRELRRSTLSQSSCCIVLIHSNEIRHTFTSVCFHQSPLYSRKFTFCMKVEYCCTGALWGGGLLQYIPVQDVPFFRHKINFLVSI